MTRYRPPRDARDTLGFAWWITKAFYVIFEPKSSWDARRENPMSLIIAASRFLWMIHWSDVLLLHSKCKPFAWVFRV